MKINFTPVKTSINYGINNFEISEDVFDVDVNSFKNFKLENTEKCEIVDLNEEVKNIFAFDKDFNKNLNLNFNKKITIKESSTLPIIIKFDIKKDENLIENLFIEACKNVKANIILNLDSYSTTTHIGKLSLFLQENSYLNVVVLTNFKNKSTNIFSHQNVILENAKLDFMLIDFGCDTSIVQNVSSLNGSSAKSNLKALYLGRQENKLDYNFVQNIFGENCLSDINVVGALFNKSLKNFKGTINFNKGCKKSVGNEKEFCMLLSNKARSKALPMLLCSEEDVSGNHSTAVGKINSKELFYVMSRGLNKKESIKLLLKAKFSNILNEIFDENLKEDVINKIDERIKL